MRRNYRFFFLITLLFTAPVFAQEKTVDRTIAVVGKSALLQSALEAQYLQYMNSGEDITEDTRCRIFEELLFQKLLYVQALKDSVEVNESQVDGEIDRRMRYFMAYFGSEEKFRDFYGKSVEQFKNDVRDDVKEFLLAKTVNEKTTSGISASPAEVKAFFESIPRDSIPYINSEVEIGQIVIKAPVSPEAKKAARERTEELRQRVLKGEDFAALAVLYSEDPGSSKDGGRYNNIQRGQFVPEFDAILFNLKEDEVSEVFETPYGYHFTQLIKRRGDFADLRHILITPKVTAADLQKAKEKADSLYTAITRDSAIFSDLAGKFSDDEETKINGGLLVNQATGTSSFSIEELGQQDPNLVFTVNNLKVGEATKPVLSMSRDGKQAYLILYLKSRTEPHIANLKDDYQRIQNLALAQKQRKLMNQWVDKKLSSTYVRIADDFQDCTFQNKWNKQSN